MQDRLAFCMQHKNTNGEEVVALDSAQAKVWQHVGQVPDVPAMRDRGQLHVYGAECVRGISELYVVTGTTGYTRKLYSKHGTRLRGVGHREFIHVLHGMKLYPLQGGFIMAGHLSCWYMEQKHLQAIDDWPGNAPDLMWMENLWGCMAHQVAGIQFKSVSAWKRQLFMECKRTPISSHPDLHRQEWWPHWLLASSSNVHTTLGLLCVQ